MKKLIILAAMLIAQITMAQSGFNYKTLITQSGNPLANHAIDLRFTILQSGTTSVYQETHTTTTDANGIVSVSIGEGTVNSGDFNTIDWSNDYALKVEIDTGSGFQDFGTKTFRYVPKAKYAETAGNILNISIDDLTDGKYLYTSMFLGSEAGDAQTATGMGNTGVGHQALKFNTGGANLTALGYRALYQNTTGTFNTAIGNSALYHNTTARDNTAVGFSTLFYNTTGYNNVALGSNTMTDNTTGNGNTATGTQALQHNTTGKWNTAVGNVAIQANTTGDYNTGVGYQALLYNTTGTRNVAIGYSSYFSDANLSNTTCIGYAAGGTVNASNRIEIGNHNVTWIGGQVPWSTYSDRRIKTHITEDVAGLDFITRLRPVTYYLDIHKMEKMLKRGDNVKNTEYWEGKYDIEQIKMTGFIAQEVEKAAKDTGYDFSGVEKGKDDLGMYSVSYAQFTVPLVKATQELNSKVERQQQTIQTLKADNQQLKAQMQMLLQRIENLEKNK